VVCPACGADIPAAKFCVRCGVSLVGRPRGFAAAPNERRRVPWVVSTLFPQLPRSSMRVFRFLLPVGLAVVVALEVARLFPLALIGSALLVPALTVTYLFDVDVYEDEPLRVLAFTLVCGAAGGVIAGVLGGAVSSSGVSLLTE